MTDKKAPTITLDKLSRADKERQKDFDKMDKNFIKIYKSKFVVR